MAIILNEYKRALEILDKHYVGHKPSETLSILARYYRHKEGKKDKEIYDLLNQHMQNYYPNYNPVKWSITLDNQVKKSKKYPLVEIDSVPVTKNEIEAIKGLHNIRMERVAFTMLALAKFSNLRNESNNGWVNREHKEIFKLARSNMTIVKQCEMIHEFKNLGYVSLSNKVDNLNMKVNYIDCESDVVIKLTDFRELGYEYMMYTGGKYIRCDKCGKLIKPNGRKKYCDECAEYQPVEFKTVVCIDCGCDVIASSKANHTNRCLECYDKYRREYYRANKKKQRLNKQECPQYNFK